MEVWDYDFLCDELVGRTQMSLTERLLSRTYMSILTKPVEERPL